MQFWNNFYGPSAIPVAQPTASKYWSVVKPSVLNWTELNLLNRLAAELLNIWIEQFVKEMIDNIYGIKTTKSEGKKDLKNNITAARKVNTAKT